MKILGCDPGETTGWVVYDADAGCVIDRGNFPGRQLDDPDFVVAFVQADVVVVEVPVAQGPTRPQVVQCAFDAGFILGTCMRWKQEQKLRCKIAGLERLEIKQALTKATLGEVRVVNDATAWAALKLLHGPGCDKRGGALYGPRAHERAALAACVAYDLIHNRTERVIPPQGA